VDVPDGALLVKVILRGDLTPRTTAAAVVRGGLLRRRTRPGRADYGDDYARQDPRIDRPGGFNSSHRDRVVTPAGIGSRVGPPGRLARPGGSVVPSFPTVPTRAVDRSHRGGRVGSHPTRTERVHRVVRRGGHPSGVPPRVVRFPSHPADRSGPFAARVVSVGSPVVSGGAPRGFPVDRVTPPSPGPPPVPAPPDSVVGVSVLLFRSGSAQTEVRSEKVPPFPATPDAGVFQPPGHPR